jgi:glycosyltransferase involved in cell wall biosynthesis
MSFAGFGIGSESVTDSSLIIVDNGSKDQTQAVAREVQNASPTRSVVLAEEPERGYVPPRRLGNVLAGEIAGTRGFSKEATLIVQADADTTYGVGFLEALRQAALSQGPGVMLDSCMELSAGFVQHQHDYIALCEDVDEEFLSLLSDNPADVVVDDKGCGYRLSDYEGWGGHQREFTVQGDEILSETTRLYLRAKAHGARRFLCEAASASHSERRVYAEPAISFATAGFPREDSFRSAWQRAYHGPTELADFSNPARGADITLAVTTRRAHLRGLFGILPLHVANTLGKNPLLPDGFKDDVASLPKRSIEILRNHPAVLLEDIFRRVDQAVFGLL